MTKKELFEKYRIDESYSAWQPEIDNWMSVEVFRVMHDGRLPGSEDTTLNYITEFLDKEEDIGWWVENVMQRRDWGSLYLTAKRMIYRHADKILKELSA